MLDDTGMIDAVAQAHPLLTGARHARARQGETVAEIVARFGLDPRHGIPRVHLVRGARSDIVPADIWHRVRPHPGTRVEVDYAVEGPVAALGAALVAAAAPTIASSVFGLTAGTLGYALATTAISVVAALAVNALIPPPPQPDGPAREAQRFAVTGVRNTENRYGPYPKVLGRHRMFPPKTARGYTETRGEDIYYRGRVTFGWGPVALDELKIGNTPIWEFDDITVAFLNVDEDETLDAMPKLAPLLYANSPWRTGHQRLPLCPDDVFEESFSVLLEEGDWTNRLTTANCEEAAVDITFLQGLVEGHSDGTIHKKCAEFEFRYRPAAGGSWTSLGTQRWCGRTRQPIRFTKEIEFPSSGQWEIGVRRTSEIDDDQEDQDTGWLTAVRSFRIGGLPSHDGIAEMAFRIRATEQLSGEVDTINAVVQQMAPVWTGSAWSAAQPVRHPAWIYLDMIRGDHLARPVADGRIDLDAFRDWATQEPHWTCDYVIEQETRLAEALDIIAATGRASRALTDFRYSILRDGGAGAIRQVFTPRNSWGFEGRIEFPPDIHGFRVNVISERQDWQLDELVVYADGYGEDNASNLETIEYPGLVLGRGAVTKGNPWRRARYDLAVATLRRDRWSWHADWESLRVTRGDKVQLVHDVPVVGVGWGRIESVEMAGDALAAFVLDEAIDVASDTFRITLRYRSGTRAVFDAVSPADPYQRRWEVAGTFEPTASASSLEGVLITVEETAEETLEALVIGVYPDADESARIVAVPAAPAVLEADAGDIPPYDPIVTPPRDAATLGPLAPQVRMAVSDETTMETDRAGVVRPRAGVLLEGHAGPVSSGSWVQLRWRETESGEPWTYGRMVPASQYLLLTEALIDRRFYEVGVRSVSDLGRSRGWVVAASRIMAQALEALPPTVAGFDAVVVDREARFQWDRPAVPDLSHVEIRYSASASGTWAASVQLDSVPVPTTRTSAFARPGTYLAKWVDGGGRKSAAASSFYLSSDQIDALNAVETVTAQPGWSGTHSATEVVSGALRLEPASGLYPAAGTWTSDTVTDLGAVYACRLTPFIEAMGLSSLDSLRGWPNLRAVPSIRASDPEGWGVEIEVAVSDDDDTAGSAWRPVTGGTFTGRYFRFRLQLRSDRTDVTPEVEALDVVIDMPDRLASGTLTVPALGAAVVFDPAFRNVPTIVVTSPDAPTGAYYRVTGKSRTGFNVEWFNAAATSIEVECEWHARGYGREIETA